MAKSTVRRNSNQTATSALEERSESTRASRSQIAWTAEVYNSCEPADVADYARIAVGALLRAEAGSDGHGSTSASASAASAVGASQLGQHGNNEVALDAAPLKHAA